MSKNNPIGQSDRDDINRLHSLGNSSIGSGQHRDASNNGTWKGNPTLIPTPNKVRSDKPGTMFTRTNVGAQRRPQTNPTAARTMANRPNYAHVAQSHNNRPRKKQKTGHSDQERVVNGKGKQGFSSRPPIAPDDLDDEDLGTRLSSVADEMNLSGQSSFSLKREKSDPMQSHYINVDNDASGDDYSRASGSRSVQDGEATKDLQRRLKRTISKDSSIESFTSPPPVPEGQVKRQIRQLESDNGMRQNQNSPRIDLRKITVKGSMKGKNAAKLGFNQRDPVAKTSDYFKTKLTVSKLPPTLMLPLKDWYLGTEHRAKDKWYLYWGKDGIWFQESEGHSNHLLSFHFEEIDFSEIMDQLEDEELVFAFMTFRPLPGHAAKGKVVILFDKEACARDAYDDFIATIRRRIKKVHSIRGAAARAVWEKATRTAELAEEKALRGKPQKARPLKCNAPDDDAPTMDESTPPPVGELIQHHVEPNASASSSRPVSRATPGPGPVVSRRSDRLHKSPPPKRRSPSSDPDEVILCYPQGIPGAVNITNADYRRLDPGEFLNDTLIEFGLKLWLKRLEESHSELAKQIHVFSSFFYKKLNKKNGDEGYESVRKWTAKFDIFSKKYIIIPINENLHWYLVIIYQPEHILLPPPISESPSTRGRRNNISGAAERPLDSLTTAKPLSKQLLLRSRPISTASKPPSRTNKPISSSSKPQSSRAPTGENSPVSSDGHPPLSSEAEVEELVDFTSSCAITISRPASPTASVVLLDKLKDAEDNLTVMPSSPTDIAMHSDSTPKSREVSPSASDYGWPGISTGSPTRDVVMEDVASTSSGGLFDRGYDVTAASGPGAVKPQNFYGKPSKKPRGKQRAEPDHQPSSIADMDVDISGTEDDPTPSSSPETKTYIITFDSLGSKHPQAIRQLTGYLQKEAADKRKILSTSKPEGKQAFVPVQPNFCDCGLYLLHFAETFMSDPLSYYQIIKSRQRGTSMAMRQKDWHDAKTADMRERLKLDIQNLSIEWKQDRAAKEEARRKEVAEGMDVVEIVESSDDEVDIVETTPPVVAVPEKMVKGKGKPVIIAEPLRFRG